MSRLPGPVRAGSSRSSRRTRLRTAGRSRANRVELRPLGSHPCRGAADASPSTWARTTGRGRTRIREAVRLLGRAGQAWAGWRASARALERAPRAARGRAAVVLTLLLALVEAADRGPAPSVRVSPAIRCLNPSPRPRSRPRSRCACASPSPTRPPRCPEGPPGQGGGNSFGVQGGFRLVRAWMVVRPQVSGGAVVWRVCWMSTVVALSRSSRGAACSVGVKASVSARSRMINSW